MRSRFIIQNSLFKIAALCTLFFFLLMPSAADAFTISKSAGNTIGLVGWWTFDKMTTGQVTDWSGQGNHGQHQNISTSTFYTEGKVGQALNFDGVNDQINTSSDFVGTNAATVCAWINPRSIGGGNAGRIVDNGKFLFLIGSATTIRLYSDGTLFGATAASINFLNKWSHVCGSRDSSGTTNMYVNGTLSGTANQNGGTPTGGTTNVIIGNVSNGTRSWDGLIEDVRIYNRALSAAEISALYKQGSAKISASQNKGPTNGLVGHWTFDGSSTLGGTIRDVSGNNNHGQHQNISTSTFYTEGKIGQALRFDGVDDYVSIPDTSAVEGQSALSVSVWVKANVSENVSTSDSIFSKSGTGADTFELLWAQNEDISFCVIGTSGTSCGGAGSASAVYTDGIATGNGKNWHHIVGVYDSNASEVKVYVNGVVGETIASFSEATQNSAHNIRISDSTGGWNGLIDDVRIYNRALSADEIKQLYAIGAGAKQNVATGKAAASGGGVGSGLVGHWTFDGSSTLGGTIRDVSGNGNHGQHQNISTSTFYTEGKIGQALRFDGVDDYVDLGDIASADGISEITVSAWFKSAVADTGRQYIVSKERGGFAGWSFRRESTDVFSFDIANANPTVTASSATFRDTLWHHVVGTYNGTTIQMYVDGIASGNAAAQTGDLSATSRNLCIGIGDNGTVCSGGNSSANAIIDDVRIYNRALSASEIRALYNAGR